jgi:predicted MFS family arabinose efflux permease
LAIIGFALSPYYVLSVALLALSGMADAMSVMIRQCSYQAHTPDEYRGRVSSVNGIFIRTSNEIGAFESGLAASLMGAVPSVIFGASVSLLVVALMRWRVGPELTE